MADWEPRAGARVRTIHEAKFGTVLRVFGDRVPAEVEVYLETPVPGGPPTLSVVLVPLKELQPA